MDYEILATVGGTAWGIWLMIVFAGIIFWAFRPKNKKRFEDDSMIPFRENRKR